MTPLELCVSDALICSITYSHELRSQSLQSCSQSCQLCSQRVILVRASLMTIIINLQYRPNMCSEITLHILSFVTDTPDKQARVFLSQIIFSPVRVSSGLTNNHYTRLKRQARDKHYSLLRTFVNYGRKKFYNIGPGRF